MNRMNDRDKAQICINVCRQVCGVHSLFDIPAENPVRIRHEDRVWTIDQFLDVNWIAWAMRFEPRCTAHAMIALTNDENLDFGSMTEKEIQFEWFCCMHEVTN